MREGMQYRINDGMTLDANIRAGYVYYETKYGNPPAVCSIHPDRANSQRGEIPQVGEMAYHLNEKQPISHLWFGPADTTPAAANSINVTITIQADEPAAAPPMSASERADRINVDLDRVQKALHAEEIQTTSKPDTFRVMLNPRREPTSAAMHTAFGPAWGLVDAEDMDGVLCWTICLIGDVPAYPAPAPAKKPAAAKLSGKQRQALADMVMHGALSYGRNSSLIRTFEALAKRGLVEIRPTGAAYWKASITDAGRALVPEVSPLADFQRPDEEPITDDEPVLAELPTEELHPAFQTVEGVLTLDTAATGGASMALLMETLLPAVDASDRAPSPEIVTRTRDEAAAVDILPQPTADLDGTLRPSVGETGLLETHRNRTTGFFVSVWDGRPYALESDEFGRWIVVCEQHRVGIYHKTRRLAFATTTAAWDWCPGCAAVIAGDDEAAPVELPIEPADEDQPTAGNPFADAAPELTPDEVAIIADLEWHTGSADQPCVTCDALIADRPAMAWAAPLVVAPVATPAPPTVDPAQTVFNRAANDIAEHPDVARITIFGTLGTIRVELLKRAHPDALAAFITRAGFVVTECTPARISARYTPPTAAG